MAVQIVQGFGGARNVIELRSTYVKQGDERHARDAYLDEAHRPVALLAETKFAIARTSREEDTKAVLERVRMSLTIGRKVADVEGVNLSKEMNQNRAHITSQNVKAYRRILVGGIATTEASSRSGRR